MATLEVMVLMCKDMSVPALTIQNTTTTQHKGILTLTQDIKVIKTLIHLIVGMVMGRNPIMEVATLQAAITMGMVVNIWGYAIELSLKARICKTLKWSGFPSTNNEFQNYQSFKVHNLDVLLHLSGMEDEIKINNPNHMADWSNVSTWNPESRYKTNSLTSELEVTTMLNSVKRLITVL